jgi:hypothetical protein
MILLISDTPVAGTVDRIAAWIERISGEKCATLIRRNYPNNVFQIASGAYGALPNWKDYFVSVVRMARVVVIHNVCECGVLDLIFDNVGAGVKVAYQYHSPPTEGPQFCYGSIYDRNYHAIFSVSQGHGRFVDGAIDVPNIVPDFNPISPLKKEKIIFIPHLRSTNFYWSNKFSVEDFNLFKRNENLLSDYKLKTIKDLFGREAVTHGELQMILGVSSIVVDDINTGLFHQTCIESLKSGSVVLSSVDLDAMERFCQAVEAPPFPVLNVQGSSDALYQIKNLLSSNMLSQMFEENIKYSLKYLSEFRLAQRYFEIFNDALRVF